MTHSLNVIDNIQEVKILLANLIDAGIDRIDAIIYITPDEVDSNHAENSQDIIFAQALSYGVILHITQALLGVEDKLSINNLFIITKDAIAVDEDEITNPFQAPLWGLGKVIAQEVSMFSCNLLDISSQDQKLQNELAKNAMHIALEVITQDAEGKVAIRDNKRLVARLVTDEALNKAKDKQLSLNIINENATYLITGGLGALGLVFAKHLADIGAKHLVLVGRNAANKEVQRQIDSIADIGVEVKVVNIDIADLEKTKDLIDAIDKKGKFALHGIIHAAGVLDDAPIVKQTFESYKKVMSPKILGTWNLHNATNDSNLDFFILFSSIASIIGNAGQVNYAAANEFMDSFASYRKSKGLIATSINWSGWADVGMAANLDANIFNRLSFKKSVPKKVHFRNL